MLGVCTLLKREGSLSCHTCCDTGPRLTWSHSKDCPQIHAFYSTRDLLSMDLHGLSLKKKHQKRDLVNTTVSNENILKSKFHIYLIEGLVYDLISLRCKSGEKHGCHLYVY